ncbi:MAG: uracil-DNA glycosylase family protein [Bacteroidaceae bacterium]|nr:uracil-DNA glycosylase family protein [Bacteroidaceae bacterium]
MEKIIPVIEEHPLQPFLPSNAKLLMLGSFPPQRKRWSMDFFYPNLQNDMWRIFGHIFFQDKEHFLYPDKKAFNKELIVDFLNEKGIALYDTATSVRRLQDNASDKFLEVVEPTDLRLLLKQLPQCQAIVTTGQKATDTIREQIEVDEPTIGKSSTFCIEDKSYQLYRMPSSSRAYPLALEKKSSVYQLMFNELGMINEMNR